MNNDSLIGEIVQGALGRGEANAWCTGCHAGAVHHVMGYQVPGGFHAYARGRDLTSMEVFESLVTEVVTREIPHERTFEPGMRIHHLVFQVGG